MTEVAVVGIGRWGKNLVRCFETAASVRYCCHAGDPGNAAWLAETYPGIDRTESYDRVLADDAVDAVVVATPVGTHARFARRALAAGKHAFVEKPLATDADVARALVDLAADRGLCLFTGYVFLHAPAIAELRRRTAEDPVEYLRADWETFGSFDARIEHALVTHDVAIGRHLFGDPFEAATILDRVGIRTDCDLLAVRFETAAGRRLVATYDRTAREVGKSVVAVTASGRRYEFADDRLYALAGDDHEDLTPADPAEPLLAECRAFVDWVEGGERPPGAGDLGAEVAAVIDRTTA